MKILAGLTRKEGKPIDRIFSFCHFSLKFDSIQVTGYDESSAIYLIRTYLKNSLDLTAAEINKTLELLKYTPAKMLNKFLFLPDQIKNIISDNKLLDEKEEKLSEQIQTS